MSVKITCDQQENRLFAKALEPEGREAKCDGRIRKEVTVVGLIVT